MAKIVKRTDTFTMEEWESTPFQFGPPTMAKIIGCNMRYVQNNAEKLGGIKLAGHWTFFKPRVAQMLGLEV